MKIQDLYFVDEPPRHSYSNRVWDYGESALTAGESPARASAHVFAVERPGDAVCSSNHEDEQHLVVSCEGESGVQLAAQIAAALNARVLPIAPQLLELARLGAQMRAAQSAAQNSYLRDRLRENLSASKQLEAKFDKATRELLARVQGETA